MFKISIYPSLEGSEIDIRLARFMQAEKRKLLKIYFDYFSLNLHDELSKYTINGD
jgi:hypothetical protein